MVITTAQLRRYLEGFDQDAPVVLEVYVGDELQHRLESEVVARGEAGKPVIYGYVDTDDEA